MDLVFANCWMTSDICLIYLRDTQSTTTDFGYVSAQVAR